MGKYEIVVQRTVVETAYITVDADSVLEAEELVLNKDIEDEEWGFDEISDCFVVQSGPAA